MKKTSPPLARKASPAKAMRPEYDLNYEASRPNRFAGKRRADGVVVLIEPDIARIFTTADSVNTALRALIGAMPKARRSGARAE